MEVSHKCYIHPQIQETWLDYPDAHSNSVSVYFYGCLHNCAGCHNPEMQTLNSPAVPVYAEDLVQLIMGAAARCKTDKVVLTGGDPLHPDNREEVIFLCYRLVSLGYDVCVYTGYDIITAMELLPPGAVKFIKCGRYVKELAQGSGKTNDEFALASTNQKLYDGYFNLLSTNGEYTF